MPSFSKVLKNEQLDTVSQFTVSGLTEFPAPVRPNTNLPGGPFDQLNSEMTVDTSFPIVNRDEISARSAPVGLSTNQTTIHQELNNQEGVHLWSVPEFRKEVAQRTNRQSAQKVEDYSYLITDAKTQAEEIISEAEKNAADIITRANNEAESLKQKAFMEGMNTSKNEVSQTMHQVERIFQETQLWQEQVMHQSQSRIMEMVLAIGKKLFGSGFELSASQIDHIVSRAINEASRLGNLRIYLHPDDAKLLVNLWQESEITLNGQQIQIVSSQNISRGGCFIDGQFGIVDGRVEEQVDQIAKSIKSAEINLEVEE